MSKWKANNIRWGIVLTYLVLGVNIVASIIYTPIMLRILGENEHGLYSTIASTMSWLNLLSLGLGASYIRYYSLYKAKNQENSIHSLNGLFMMVFTVLGVIAFVLGFIISQNLGILFGNGLTASEYRLARVLSLIVSVDLALGFPISVFAAIIRAQEKFILAKLLNLFQAIAHPLTILPLLFFGYGAVGVVIGTLVVNLITYVVNIYYCLRKLKIKFVFKNFEKGLLRRMLVFSLFIAINSVINQVNTSLDKILIARYIGTAAVSIYTIGFSLYSYYASFSSAISSVFTPRINRIVNENITDKLKMKKELTFLFVKVGRIQFYIQMLIMMGLVFFGKPFIAFWAGEGYGEAYYIVLLLAGAYTVPLCQGLGIEIQRAQNKHKIRTIVYIFMTFINIVVTVFLCQIWGGIGAAIGTAVAVFAVEIVFMNIYYHKKLNVDIICFWKNIARVSIGLILPLGVGIGLMIAFPMDEFWRLLIGIVIFCVSYFVSIWLLSLNRYEKDLIFKPLKKMFKAIKNIFIRKKKVQQ